MTGRLFAVVKLVFVFALVFVNSLFAQRVPPEVQKILKNLPPDTMQKIIAENQPKGEMTFTALPPQQFFKPPVGVAGDMKPYEKWFQSGAAVVYELDKCAVDGKESIYIKSFYVLYLDEEKLDSTFTTNQKARTANIKIKGRIERWRGRCNSKEFRRAGSGDGGLEFSFVNNFHIRPRWFSASRATGRIFGAGLNETVAANSTKGEPVAYSYAKSENKSAYDPKLLDALRKAGFPIPNVDPAAYEKSAEEYLKANGLSLDLSKAAFYGRLESARRITIEGGTSVAAMQVDFAVSSDFEADMLVYKPKAIAESEVSPVADSENAKKNLLFDGGFLRNAAFTSNFNENFFSNIVSQQQNLGGVLIPKGLRTTVGAQGFVNLDNDDRDDKFDLDDAEVTKGDDDLVKVVLRAKITGTLAAKAQFEITKGADNVKVYFSEDKKIEFKKEDMQKPLFITRDFPVTQGEFRTKTLWIEGIGAHSNQKDTEFRFRYWQSGDITQTPGVDDRFNMTVIGIEAIEWEGKNNSVKNDNNLDADVNHRNPNDAFTNTIDAARNNRTFSEECGGKVESTLTEPEAVRVFPGARLEGATAGARRNKVNVKVKLSVAPVEPVNLFFRSFDVDDASVSDASETPTDKTLKNLDNETKEEDNRGTTLENNSKAGFLDGENGDRIMQKEFSGQNAEFEFTVTMQPGDNFRIAGFGDKKFLPNLENNDQKLNIGSSEAVKNRSKQRIVDKFVFAANPQNPSGSEIREAKKYASKTLTVWRFLYGEVDYLGEISENKIKGAIGKIENDTPRTGLTTVHLKVNLTEEYKKISNVSTLGINGVENAFQEGKLRVGGIEYDVLYNSAQTGRFTAPNDYVVVRRDVPANLPEDSTFFLWDDDDETWGFRKGTMLRDVRIRNRNPNKPDRESIEKGNACYVAERYLPAYVVPDFKTLIPGNTNHTVEFVRNVRAEAIGTNADRYFTKEHYKFDFDEYEKSEDFWTIYMLYGYKGATYEDGDPDGGSFGNPIIDTRGENAIEGFTDLDFTGIMFFLEGIIERNDGYQEYNGKTGEEDCIAHEIGHIFGAKHEDLGLMGGSKQQQNSTVFTGTTLERIRSAKYP